ncbi:MAG: hemolysin III family protein, partial [Oscillospiraceae bacterium]|nr:hemolysin III family protein [Oscillospiraceae bacterium]
MKEANAIRSEKRKQLGLPQYTLMEEILNSVTHGLGAALAAVGLVLLLLKTHGTIPRLSILFYCISAVALYTNSAIYHGAKVGRAKTYLRVVDHCTIFLLIAGTYTPFLFITLHDTKLLSAGIFLGVTAAAI